MANIQVNDKVYDLGTFNGASGSTEAEFIPGEVVDVFRVIIVPTTSYTGAGVITIYKRPTAGSATDQVLIGTYTIGAVAAGKSGYKDLVYPVAAAVAEDGSIRNVDPVGPLHVVPGESIFFDVTTAASAGTGKLFIQGYAQGYAEVLDTSDSVKGT